jgi:hypothetical protein
MSANRENSNLNLIRQASGAAVLWLVLYALLPACNQNTYLQDDIRQQDTVDVRILPIDQLRGVELAVGQNLSIPDMDIEIVRVSEKEVLVRTPVRTETRTRTTFVPVRNVDKSRTSVRTRLTTKVDNSVKTDTDIRTKEDNDVRTKEVDKSQTDSGNKTRTKTVDKDITRNGFPWWIIILATVLTLLGYLAKRAGKLPFI